MSLDVKTYNLIFRDFCEWVEGIEEEEPLSLELKYVYFCYSLKGNILSLIYAANERKQTRAINFDYFPLEGQFFFNKNFYSLDSQGEIEKVVCMLVENFLSLKRTESWMGKRKIICSKLNEIPFYCFN